MSSGEPVAIKVIRHKEEALDSVRRETAISMRVAHPNVVRTLHYYTSRNGGAVAQPDVDRVRLKDGMGLCDCSVIVRFPTRRQTFCIHIKVWY